MRLKLTLEYEGSGFSGWAAQPGLRTIEAVVREALGAVFPSLAGLAVAGLSLSIAVLMGEQLPTIMPGRAFTTAIPVELLIVPLGVAVAWMEAGRFLVLFRRQPAGMIASVRPEVIPANERNRAS